MEEDDEFGDLYTDVLQPFTSAPAPPPPPTQPSHAPQPHRAAPAPSPPRRPIDLNLKISDDDGIIPPAPTNRTLAPATSNSATAQGADGVGLASLPRVFDRPLSTELPKSTFEVDAKLRINPRVEVIQESKGVDLMDTDVKFDIEEPDAGPDDGNLIPGLSTSRQSNGGDDWDSDSEDELQIVLNENPPHGPMGMFGDGGDDDDDDEDGEPLVIVADGVPNQPMEETEWGEDAGQTGPDGERKETGGAEAGKTTAAVAVPPKIGYSSHGYHPFHSQFKYVRPGAAPMPGSSTAGPGGAPNQVRPPISVGPMAGRGRGEWRPAGGKGGPAFQKAGFGGPAWGSGRGFGGGLEFTLPSHKTIFEVDIDSFEEKPWKYPGVDITDFFNFGLNEESWKDYSKQLEQHRLETTMQSRIRVYESVRTEQEFDPDMPPELAAATGIHDVPAEKANLGKAEAGQIDSKAPPRVRPPLPTGRAIQVEGGCGERQPSIDTRPPRIRDSDAIIEIICQDSLDDDSSIGQGAPDHNEPPSDDVEGDHKAGEFVPEDNRNSSPETFSSEKREPLRRVTMKSTPDRVTDGGEVSPLRPKVTSQYSPASRAQVPVPGKDNGIHQEDRRTPVSAHHRSLYESPTYSAKDKKFADDREGSIDSMARKAGVRGSSSEHNDDTVEGISEPEKKDMRLDVGTTDTVKDDGGIRSGVKQKLTSRVDPSARYLDEGEEDSRAARSSENSKARSGSSREYQKWHDGNEEEVIQAGRSMRTANDRRYPDKTEQDYRRGSHEATQDMDRSRSVVKGWEGSYKDSMPMKSETLDRRKERDKYDKAWQWRDDDPQGRRIRAEDTRKRDRIDEVGSRHRSRGRENERSDKDEYFPRKDMDNGIHETNFDKDIGSRPRERDDSSRSRYESAGDYHKRRKEEPLRREHADRGEMMHGHRESTGRPKRERERDDIDEQYFNKNKDDISMPKERGERQKNREGLSRVRQTHDEDVPKREREGQGSLRSGRGAEDKSRTSHTRLKDDYRSDKDHHHKDTSRHAEQLKSRDRTVDDSIHHRGREDVHSRGNQVSYEEKRSRQERLTSRSDRSTNVSENQKVREREHREGTKRSKETDAGDNNAAAASKRNQDDQMDRVDEMGLPKAEGGNGNPDVPLHHQSSRKHKEDASSDEEQSDARRGRSKLERWTSHKERDYTINSKSSSSLKMKELGRNSRNGGPKEYAKAGEAVTEEKDSADVEIKSNADSKPAENRHLDTVEKLKKRSERFKLPMPSEKEAQTVKKMENEALPPAISEAPAETETKHERPARKRRWVSS